MISIFNRGKVALVLLSFMAVGGLSWEVFAGSKKTNNAGQESNSTSDNELSGQELWTMNCRQCHNIRSPTMYSNAQWDVIVHHMRVRANITGEEQRAIVEFLKSAK